MLPQHLSYDQLLDPTEDNSSVGVNGSISTRTVIVTDTLQLYSILNSVQLSGPELPIISIYIIPTAIYYETMHMSLYQG